MARELRDFATVLTHPSLPMAKTWKADGTIAPYSTAKFFQLRRVPLGGFRDLCDLLSTLGSAPRSCVIRGKYKGDDYAKKHAEEYKEGLVSRANNLYEDDPHHWMLVEVDEFEPIGADPVLDPVGAITEYLESSLPQFARASYYWQLSNSAGHESNAGKLKVHLWFWLATPCTSTQLREWAKVTKQPLDVAVFQKIQVHYTAKPIFQKLDDPVPVRQGRVDGELEEVEINIAEAYDEDSGVTRTEMIDATYQADPVAQRLFERGMVKEVGKAGELFIECPCSSRHTGESGETSTVYYPANTGGYANGNFKCLHSHCVDAPQFEFVQALGFTPADDFDDISDTPLAPIPDALAEQKADRFLPIHASLFSEQPSPPWLIKRLLPAEGLAVIYGPPGSGKSFIALDIVCALARGLPNWRGHRIPDSGRVAYVCAEGAGGFRHRLAAYAKKNDIDLRDLDLFIIPAAPNLLKGDDVKALIRALHKFGPFSLIVVDTLARSLAGGNENSSEDMGQAIDQCGVISEVLRTLVLLIHHSGKDDSKGARGHSSLRGAADVEMETSRDGEDRVLHISKLKDGEDNVDHGFRLEIVELGVDVDGDPITSCVVETNEVTRRSLRKSRKRGPNENLLVDIFVSLCTNPDQGITQNELLEGAIMSKGEPDDWKLRNSVKANLSRALKTLIRDEVFICTDGVITMETDLS